MATRSSILLITGIIVATLVGAGLYSYLSPGITLQEIREAARNDNKERLRELIDFDSVKTGLKEDFKAQFLASADIELKSNPFAGLGLMMVNAVVDPLVDILVSPAGIAGIVDKTRSGDSKRGQESTPTLSSISNKSSEGGMEIDRGYDGFSRYRIRVREKSSDETTALTLRREGPFSWRLTSITPPKNLLTSSKKSETQPNDKPILTALTQSEIAALVGKDPQEAIKTPILQDRLEKLLAEKWQDFENGFTDGKVVKDADGFLYGSGCAPHSCGDYESFFSIEKSTKKIFALLQKGGEWTVWGAKTPVSDLRGPARTWAIEREIIEVDCVETEKLKLKVTRCNR